MFVIVVKFVKEILKSCKRRYLCLLNHRQDRNM